MTTKFFGMAAAAIVCSLGPGLVQADSIGDVEGARAKERQGRYLNGMDREQLRRHGGNDDYGWRSGYRDGYYDDAGSYGGASVYVGPRHYSDPYDD